MGGHDRSNDDRRPRKHKERESSTSNRKHRRHSRSESPSHKRRRDDESKEESLLRKAREYVEEHEKRNATKAHTDDHDDSRKKHRHHGSRERKDERKDREKGHATEKHRSHERHGQSEKSDLKRDRKEKDKNESDVEERKHKHHGDHKEKRNRKEEKREEEGHGKKKKHKSSGKKGKSTKPPDKSSLYPLGPLRVSPPDVSLDEEADYFEYHSYLRLYLYREKGAYFEDLTAEEARSAFSKFVRQYNEGSIEEGYYDPKGPPAPALEQCKRTRHAWGFKTNEMDKKHLELLREGVRKQTEYSVSGQEASSAAAAHPRPGVAVRPTASNTAASTTIGENRRKSKEEIMAGRVQNKRLREHVRTTHEELTGGRKEGHERQREKRQELATKIHGAARDREAGGAVELDDAALYGDDGRSSFQNALAREKQRESRKKEQRTARLTELQQKEKDKQAAMLQMLGLSGLQPGQKITIAPRKDT
eukprot:scaffold41063_cov52-Attheya_sp.AAC.1